MLSPSFDSHFFPLFCRLHTTLWQSSQSGELPGTHMRALSSSAQHRNCYELPGPPRKQLLLEQLYSLMISFQILLDNRKWEGDWMGGWNWRCKERPAKFWIICCAVIQPLVLTWLNAALPLGSHRLLYCVIIIISWHIWKSFFCFLIVSSIVYPHENPREETVCWSPTWFISRSFLHLLLSKAKDLPLRERDVGWEKPLGLYGNWISSLQIQSTSVQGCQPHKLTSFLQTSVL